MPAIQYGEPFVPQNNPNAAPVNANNFAAPLSAESDPNANNARNTDSPINDHTTP